MLDMQELENALWMYVADLPRNPAQALAEFYRKRDCQIDEKSFEQGALVTRGKWWESGKIPAEVLEFESSCVEGAEGLSFSLWIANHIIKQMGDGWSIVAIDGKLYMRDLGNVFKGEEFTMNLSPDAAADYKAGEVYKMGKHFFACTAVAPGRVNMIRTSPPSYMTELPTESREEG